MNAITQTPTGNKGGTQQLGARCIPERATICAKSIMTSDIVTVSLDTAIREIARLLIENHFTAVPVVDGGAVVGIVTEGDLLRREELGTDALNTSAQTDANYVKSHGRCARDVMTPNVVTVTEQASLAEIAELMEARHIKRVPVMREGKMVGIVSRSDIVRALVARPEESHGPLSCDDDIIRHRVIETLMNFPGASAWLTTVNVANGVVELSGTVEDEAAREPSRLVVEKISCIVTVNDHRCILQPY